MNAIKLRIACLEKTISKSFSNKVDTTNSDDATKSKVQLADNVKQSDITKSSDTTVTHGKEFSDKESTGHKCIMKLKENKNSKNAKKANQISKKPISDKKMESKEKRRQAIMERRLAQKACHVLNKKNQENQSYN